MILKHNPRSYIFRLRIPFDNLASPRNYLTKILNYDTLLNAENSLSHRGDFSRNCIDLLESKVPHGIYNISNKGSVTTKEVTSLLKKYGPSKKEFKFFKSSEDFSKAIIAPRSNCVLDTSKLEKYTKVRSVQEALEDSIKTIQ